MLLWNEANGEAVDEEEMEEDKMGPDELLTDVGGCWSLAAINTVMD
jgi:hypothetical protein